MLKRRGWKKIKSKIVYKNPWIFIKEDLVIRPDGKESIYGYLSKKSGTFIIAVDSEKNVYFLRQFRYPINKYILDLPGGVTGDKNVLKYAKKELLEETGIIAKKWQKLGGFYVAPGHESTYMHVYLAKDLKTSSQTTSKQEGDEAISEIVKIKIPRLKKMIKEGKIECGISLAALNIFLTNTKYNDHL